ncbi:MAG: TIGR04282 family arsenosugar biosynthesis glycosyltransferase [Candidatus Brocadiales bacterium]
MDNSLLIFLKYPEAGEVKTRLARGIGGEKAARLYRLFVDATLKRTLDRNELYEQLLFYAPVERGSEIKSWIGGSGGDKVTLSLQPQIGSDLGERMLNALKAAFSNGAKKAVIIGTDSPTLDKETIYEAFYLLKNTDIVIGPAVDGGYYLIGASLPAPREIFIGIDWGSNKVFEQTIKRIRGGNASYSLLPLHYDVDNLEDLRTLKKEITHMDDVKRCGLLDIYKMLVEELNI